MKKIIFYLFLLLQTTIFSQSLDKQPLIKRLDNNITYCTLENNYPNNKGVFKILTNIGILNEKEENRGIIKILENLILNNNIKKYIDTQKANVYFDIDVNNTTITIEFSELTIGMEIVKNILTTDITNFEFAKNTAIKNLNSDINQFSYSNNFTNIILGNENIDTLSLTTFNSLNNIDKDSFKNFCISIFNPQNISFVAVGNFDKYIVEKFLIDNFSVNNNDSSLSTPQIKYFQIPNSEKKYISYSKQDNQTPNIINLIQIFNRDEKDKIKEDIILDFTLGIINNRLYNEQNILNGSSYIFAKNKNQIVLTTIFFTDKKVSPYFTPIFVKKIKELKLIGISNEEFLQEKELFKERYKNMFNNPENNSNNSYAEIIVDSLKYDYPVYFNGNYSLETIDNLSYDEVNNFIKELFSKNVIEYYFLRK